MAQSNIEWTDLTWNPTTGCDKVSQGCKFCYAEVMSNRLAAMGQPKYINNFDLTIHPEELDRPKTWRGSKKVFVNSMSDLFHEKVPYEFIEKVFKVMNETPQHTYQILTKRAEFIFPAEAEEYIKWSKNIWMGISIENAKHIDRIDCLRDIGAHIKFLSCEPLIGPIPNMDLTSIDWVIVGGESGHGARGCKLEWIEDIANQCKAAGIPVFVKQLGSKLAKAMYLKSSKGNDINEFPEHLRIREFPITK